MSFLKRIYSKSKKSLKFSASDPSTFEEVWSFTSTRIRVLSLFLVVVILIGALVLYLFGGLFTSGSGGDVPIERKKLEEYKQRIEVLTKKLDNRDKYDNRIRRILSGKVAIPDKNDSTSKNVNVHYGSLDDKFSKSEKELSKKVRNDMRTIKGDNSAIPYFKHPVKGVLSQKFNKKNHPGIDIVTEKDHAVKACLSGTVIYSGYTRKDGYILILDHANGYLSVYKHNRTALKKMGAKVQLGDPIAIVGNTGENSDGPHLHFELWYDQIPVNPEDYISFKN